jgi:hypothetical protein
MSDTGRSQADGWAHGAARFISICGDVSFPRTAALRSCIAVGNHPTRNLPSGFQVHGHIESYPADPSDGIATAPERTANSRGCWFWMSPPIPELRRGSPLFPRPARTPPVPDGVNPRRCHVRKPRRATRRSDPKKDREARTQVRASYVLVSRMEDWIPVPTLGSRTEKRRQWDEWSRRQRPATDVAASIPRIGPARPARWVPFSRMTVPQVPRT